MQKTFRAEKGFLALHLFAMAFCLVVWMAISGAILTHDESPSRWHGVALFGCLFGFLALLFCYAFVRDWRTLLTFDDDGIVQQGIFRRLEFKLADVIEADWTGGQGVTLSTPSQTCTISFLGFRTADKRWMARALHYRLLAPIQRNWADFCTLALERMKATEDLGPAPEGYIRVTRKRMARIFLPSIILLVIVATGTWIVTGRWHGYLLILFVAFFWWAFRKLTPSQGVYEHSATATTRDKAFLWTALFVILSSIVGILVVSRLTQNPLKTWLNFGIVLAECGIMCLAAPPRRPRPRMTSEPNEAIARWEALNPPLDK